MTRLMIELPEELEAKLEVRAAQGGFANAQEYLRALITADTAQLASAAPPHLTFKTKSDFEKLVLEGLNSGDGGEITAQEWDEKRRSLRERYPKPAAT